MADPVGLCKRCRHARVVTTPRSRFWRCTLASEDVRFERYPQLPVLTCEGFETPPEHGESDAVDHEPGDSM